MNEQKHAELGGSSAYQWVNCPGSVFLRRKLPPQTVSPAMLLGTKQHEVNEIVLEDFLQHKLTGSDPEIRAHLIASAEMEETADAFKDAVWNKVLEGSITGKAYALEDRVTIDETLGMYGTADFWAAYVNDRGKRVAVIVDYKNGYHVVDVNVSVQLPFYAVAIREEFRRLGKDIDLVRAAIYQPRAGGEPYRETSFTPKELDTWQKRFYKAAHTIYVEKKAKFKYGDWCETCSARVACEEYVKKQSQITALRLVDIEHETFPDVATLDETIIRNLILYEDRIVSYLKECKRFALAKALNGEALLGLKIVEGPTRRRWKENEALATFDSVGLTKYVTKDKLMGIGEAQKILRAHVTKEEAQELIDKLTEKPAARPILVSESDPRLAYAISSDLLSDLTNEEE